MKKIIAFMLMLSMMVGGTANIRAEGTGFSDLDSSHWAYENIMSLTKNGIVSGYPDGTFKPNANITRGEFCLMLSTIAKLEPVYNYELNHWAAPYVQAIKKKTYSYRDWHLTNYEYDVKISRAEAALGLAEMHFGSPLSLSHRQNEVDTKLRNTFNDFSAFGGYKNYICYALENNLMSGYPDGTFCPNKQITRAEMCAILDRAFLSISKDNNNGNDQSFPEYLTDFHVQNYNNTLRVFFSFENDGKQVRYSGKAKINIKNSSGQLVYSKEHTVTESMFAYYTKESTGDKQYLLCEIDIPLSSIQEGKAGRGTVTLDFSNGDVTFGQVWDECYSLPVEVEATPTPTPTPTPKPTQKPTYNDDYDDYDDSDDYSYDDEEDAKTVPTKIDYFWVDYVERSEKFEVQFSLEDNDRKNIKYAGVAKIQIENNDGDIVYSKNHTINESMFEASNYMRCTIDIPISKIEKGKIKYGTVLFDFSDDGVELGQEDFMISDLPILTGSELADISYDKSFTLEFPSYYGEAKMEISSFEITDIQPSSSGSIKVSYEVKGVVEGYNYCIFYMKCYDADDIMIEKAVVHEAVSEGETFKVNDYTYIPEDTVRIEFEAG